MRRFEQNISHLHELLATHIIPLHQNIIVGCSSQANSANIRHKNAVPRQAVLKSREFREREATSRTDLRHGCTPRENPINITLHVHPANTLSSCILAVAIHQHWIMCTFILVKLNGNIYMTSRPTLGSLPPHLVLALLARVDLACIDLGRKSEGAQALPGKLLGGRNVHEHERLGIASEAWLHE